MFDGELIRDTATQDRNKYFRELEKTLDVDFNQVRALDETYGKGMREGSVKFTPSRIGTSGELRYTVEENGKVVTKKKQITDEDEAVALTGLQGYVDSKK